MGATIGEFGIPVKGFFSLSLSSSRSQRASVPCLGLKRGGKFLKKGKDEKNSEGEFGLSNLVVVVVVFFAWVSIFGIEYRGPLGVNETVNLSGGGKTFGMEHIDNERMRRRGEKKNTRAMAKTYQKKQR